MQPIYLPATHKFIPVHIYVDALKVVKANPNATFPHGLNSWYSKKGIEIYKEYIEAIHDRINLRARGLCLANQIQQSKTYSHE